VLIPETGQTRITQIIMRSLYFSGCLLRVAISEMPYLEQLIAALPNRLPCCRADHDCAPGLYNPHKSSACNPGPYKTRPAYRAAQSNFR